MEKNINNGYAELDRMEDWEYVAWMGKVVKQVLSEKESISFPSGVVPSGTFTLKISKDEKWIKLFHNKTMVTQFRLGIFNDESMPRLTNALVALT